MVEVRKDNIDDDNVSRREFVRTDDNIPVYYEVFNEAAAARKDYDWEKLLDDIEAKADDNPRLYELLFDINQKLNMLINYMSEKSGFKLPEAKNVNISGGGVKFTCSDFFPDGDKILIRTFLPTHSHVLKLHCEVVRSTPHNNGTFEVAARFLDVDETTRDKIIKYIFAKQRKLLRHDR